MFNFLLTPKYHSKHCSWGFCMSDINRGLSLTLHTNDHGDHEHACVSELSWCGGKPITCQTFILSHYIPNLTQPYVREKILFKDWLMSTSLLSAFFI